MHTTLQNGRWQTLTLAEQLGNIGSEVGRAINAHQLNNPPQRDRALQRALELFDLTIAQTTQPSRLKELLRARGVVSDYLVGTNEYNADADSLNRYFLQFGLAARLKA